MARRAGLFVVLAVLGAALVGALATLATAQSGGQRFSADRMRGSFEIPAVSTVARGEFEARLVNTSSGPAIDYELSYENLEGDVTQAHIHFAQNFANGGIVAWLCETTTNNDPTTDEVCPPDDGTVVEGRITPAQITASGGAQRIAAGDFDEVVAAMRAGLTYANVHTVGSGSGEIRAQIRRGGGGDDDD
jgi:CHRD domain